MTDVLVPIGIGLAVWCVLSAVATPLIGLWIKWHRYPPPH